MNIDRVRQLISSNKTLIIVLALLIILFAGSGVLLLASQQGRDTISQFPIFNLPDNSVTTIPTPTITPVSTIQPTPRLDVTASWNTFLNSKYGYSIKFPIDWTVRKAGELEPKIPDYVIFNPEDATTSASTITISYSTRTYEEALSIDSQKGLPITVALVGGTQKVQKDSNGNIVINVILPKKPNSIIFYAKEKYSDIFIQMLSTFKFLK